MIKVHCFTNLDEYKRQDWPSKMCCRPRVGDNVQAASGRRLRIVAITHRQWTDIDGHEQVTLDVELHK